MKTRNTRCDLRNKIIGWAALISYFVFQPSYFALAEEAAPDAETAASGEPVYVYKGGRDPFLPLAGTGSFNPIATTRSEETEFNVGGLELKGILTTKTGRWAVLRSSDGGSYLVKDGKIQDPKRKTVNGFVGIVKEKSLVIIGPNNQVTELKLKKDQEPETPQ